MGWVPQGRTVLRGWEAEPHVTRECLGAGLLKKVGERTPVSALW